MSTENIKEEAHEIYVRQCIEAGLADSEAGKVTEIAEVRAQFGLQP